MIYKQLMIVVLALTMAAAGFAQPRIEIENNGKVDWGEIVPKDSPLKAKLKIKNVGTEKLIVHKVSPACGCTTAPLDKNEINPGDYATLNITLHVENNTGKVHKTISVTTNDPNKRLSVIDLLCDVAQPLTVFPRAISLPGLSVGKSTTGKAVISNKSDKDITLMDIEPVPDGLSLNVSKGVKIPPKGQLTIEAYYTPKEPGRVNGRIKIKTDSEDVPFLYIAVTGMAQP